MDKFNPGSARAGDMAKLQRPSVDAESSSVGPQETGRDTRKGRLAGAILTDNGVDRTALERNLQIVERGNTSVGHA